MAIRLFSGRIGCFSPSVSRSVRVEWVKYGGRLVKTAQDFAEADTFFCVGIEDPWWAKLRSKIILVINPKWIASCIAEQFLMPLDHFILDKIAETDSLEDTTLVDPDTREAWTQDLKSGVDSSALTPALKDVLRGKKRGLEEIEESFIVNYRPHKKTRLCNETDSENVFRRPDQPPLPVLSCSGATTRVDLRKQHLGYTKRLVEGFEVHVFNRQRRSAWDDIYKTYVQKTLKEPVQSKLSVPRIAIDVLLAVPRCLDVAGFARRRMYRGKVFSCGRIV